MIESTFFKLLQHIYSIPGKMNVCMAHINLFILVVVVVEEVEVVRS